MKIKALDGQSIEELSMIEVAHAILEQKGKELLFSDIIKGVKDYLKRSDEDIDNDIARFYTELNTDGSFIPLGANKWGLRSWYPIDSIDEETISLDYFEDPEEAIIDVPAPVLEADSSADSDKSFDSTKAVEEIVYDENTDDESADEEAFDVSLEEVDVNATELPEAKVTDEEK